MLLIQDLFYDKKNSRKSTRYLEATDREIYGNDNADFQN